MKKSFFVLVFVFAIVLLLTTVGVAGEGKKKGKEKVEVCHITGTYDFGDGDYYPIGHVINIAESAYRAHHKQGDPENWGVVTLDDGSEACLRFIEVCHFEEKTYDFGYGKVPIGDVINIPESAYQDFIKDGDLGHWDVVTLSDGSEACLGRIDVCYFEGDTGDFEDGEGAIPIGSVIKIPESNYQDFINQGHPEIWKDGKLPDGTEVCLGSELEEGQFGNGVALFGYENCSHFWDEYNCSGVGHSFMRHLTSTAKVGVALASSNLGSGYDSMTPLYIDGTQYIMGISSNKYDNQYHWFIQRIFPSGDYGPVTDSGYFNHYYKTLIAMTMVNGKVFIFGQEDGGNNHAFTWEVLPGGKLAEKWTWVTDCDTYYDTATPLPLNNGRTCFFVHNSHSDNAWIINCLCQGLNGPEGWVYRKDAGRWDDGWQVALSFRSRGQSYLFVHRHHWNGYKYKGPWYILKITDNSNMGSITDHGTWDNWYKSMTIFKNPFDYRYYFMGENTDRKWFIQHVSSYGHMDERVDGGFSDSYYEHLFPIDFDTTYLQPDIWMGRLNGTIGDRKLSQIALPGSHDAGMNEDDRDGCTFGARECNTITQLGNIKHQLEEGSRYFDIRPKIAANGSGADWSTGHVTRVGDAVLGCEGEDKWSIINGLNDFFEAKDIDGNLKHKNELVILKVSHCTVPPQWACQGGYAVCTDAQINEMASNLSWHLDNYMVKCDPDVDNCNLNEMTLNEILGFGNIILVVDGAGARDRRKGIFSWGSGGDYYVYDQYSNKNDFDEMEVDQKSKLLNPYHHPGYYDGFLLSWTLTLTGTEAMFCDNRDGILAYASKAEPLMYQYMFEWGEAGDLTQTLFPNILYVDAFNRTATNAAIYLNELYDSLDE